MIPFLWLTLVFFFSAVLSIVLGALVYTESAKAFQTYREAILFDRADRCIVVYSDCSFPNVAVLIGSLSFPKKIWDRVDATYFCQVPSPSIFPCWWSTDAKLANFVRIGPVPEVSGFLAMGSALLMAAGGLLIALIIAFVYVQARRTGCCWFQRGGHEGQGGRDRPHENEAEMQMNTAPFVVEEMRLSEVYPMSDPAWSERAMTQNAYAQKRLDILSRFFSRRRQSETRERGSEPYVVFGESDTEVDYDDDDLPVDECYVCLSRLRRRMIWWPCGHWLCASCARKVLRKAAPRGFASCPHCRSPVAQEDLLVLHLLPKAMSPPLVSIREVEADNAPVAEEVGLTSNGA